MVSITEILLLIILGLTVLNIYSTKKSKMIYKYIPSSTENLYEKQVNISDIFKDMFNNPSPWTDNFRI